MATITLAPAAALNPGDIVDFDPTAPYLSDTNRIIAEFETAVIESVNGGWADNVARDGEVVLYVPTFADPIVLPADTALTVIGHQSVEG